MLLNGFRHLPVVEGRQGARRGQPARAVRRPDPPPGGGLTARGAYDSCPAAGRAVRVHHARASAARRAGSPCAGPRTSWSPRCGPPTSAASRCSCSAAAATWSSPTTASTARCCGSATRGVALAAGGRHVTVTAAAGRGLGRAGRGAARPRGWPGWSAWPAFPAWSAPPRSRTSAPTARRSPRRSPRSAATTGPAARSWSWPAAQCGFGYRTSMFKRSTGWPPPVRAAAADARPRCCEQGREALAAGPTGGSWCSSVTFALARDPLSRPVGYAELARRPRRRHRGPRPAGRRPRRRARPAPRQGHGARRRPTPTPGARARSSPTR